MGGRKKDKKKEEGNKQKGVEERGLFL